MSDELRIGDLVAFKRGLAEVRGTIADIYGPKGNQRAVVALDPQTSGYVVDEPTTVALPIARVRKVVAAA